MRRRQVCKGVRKKSLGTWDTRPLDYSEWVELAGMHPEQDLVWRSHEYHGRINEREKRAWPEYYDMGGEA